MAITRVELRRIIEQVVGYKAPKKSSDDNTDYLQMGSSSIAAEPGSQAAVKADRDSAASLTKDRQDALDKGDLDTARTDGHQLQMTDDELQSEAFFREIIREMFVSDDFRDVYATAQMAHTGQKRRSGEDYFTHPSEVRNIVARFYPRDRISQLAALLHDTLEDAPGSTVGSQEEMEEFIRGSITDPRGGEEVTRVVRALTHEKGGDYLSYVVSLMGDQPSLRVKLADMVHNLSSNPSPKQKTKYRSAINAISQMTKGAPPQGISSDHWDKLFFLTEGRTVRTTHGQLRKAIREALDLDLDVGDVVLTGRFKNKRTVVKKVGTDDLGQPTVNDMKALSFRIEKLMPKAKWSKKTLDELENEETG